MGQKKGQHKMSIAEFLGGTPAPGNMLPTAPNRRWGEKDGSLNCKPRRNAYGGEFDRDCKPNRSDTDTNWRRRGGGGQGERRGYKYERHAVYNNRGGHHRSDRRRYGDHNTGSHGPNKGNNGSNDRRGFHDPHPSRADKDYDWRRGGGRGGYDHSRHAKLGNQSDRGREEFHRDGSEESSREKWTRLKSQLTHIEPRVNDNKYKKDKNAKKLSQDEEHTGNHDEEESADISNIFGNDSKGGKEKEGEKVVGIASEKKDNGRGYWERKETKQREPMVINSRAALFAASFATKRDGGNQHQSRSHNRHRRDHNCDVGPHPVVNDRFVKTDTKEKQKSIERDFRRHNGRSESHDESYHFAASTKFVNSPIAQMGGPLPHPRKSRYTAAMEADKDHEPNENRSRKSYNIDLSKDAVIIREPSLSTEGLIWHESKKKEISNILLPKYPHNYTVLPPVEAPLTLPGEDEEAAKARLEKKRREKEDKALAEKESAQEAAAAKAAAEKKAADIAARAAAVESDLLNEFISGNNLGDELQQWCTDQGSVLPAVEKLVFHILIGTEKKGLDPECSWAQPENYGAALLSLVEYDINGQMQVLWAIQKYCDTQGFPKVDGQYLVQSMFCSMYKYDLAEASAFEEWKEDESEENSMSKMKALVQTVQWFNWLEADDDDDDDDCDDDDDDDEIISEEHKQ